MMSAMLRPLAAIVVSVCLILLGLSASPPIEPDPTPEWWQTEPFQGPAPSNLDLFRLFYRLARYDQSDWISDRQHLFEALTALERLCGNGANCSEFALTLPSEIQRNCNSTADQNAFFICAEGVVVAMGERSLTLLEWRNAADDFIAHPIILFRVDALTRNLAEIRKGVTELQNNQKAFLAFLDAADCETFKARMAAECPRKPTRAQIEAATANLKAKVAALRAKDAAAVVNVPSREHSNVAP